MTDLTRLADEVGGDELEAQLLQFARGEGPSPDARRKILAGIAAGGVATLAAGTAKATATAAASKLTMVKWGALVAVVAAAVPAAIWLSKSDEGKTNKAVPSALKAPATEVKAVPLPPSNPPQAEGPAPLSLDDLPTLPSEAPAVGAAPQTKPQGSLADEVAQLQKAKLALKAGNASQALSELGTYAQRFPRPMLGAEATVLRIEALSASGDSARAKSMATSFLAKNPTSPYAARLRKLTGAE
jgi:hypothetical protein